MSEDEVSVAYKDQSDAAVEDAKGFLKEVERQTSEDPEKSDKVESAEIPADVIWSSYVGRKFVWVDEPKLMKRLTWCKHASLAHPGIFVISTNRPNHVDCLPCGSRRRSRTLAQDLVPCDMCGKADEDGFHETIFQAGFFLISANLCPPCQQEQDRSVEILTEKYNEVMKEQENETDDNQ